MRTARRRARRERDSGLVLAAVLALLAAAAGAEALAGVGDRPAPAPVEQNAARAGMWYCPYTAGEQEQAVLSVAAVGDQPSVVTVVRYRDGSAVTDPPEAIAVSPGDQLELVLPPGEATVPVAVRWEGGPSAAFWRVDGQDTAGARCEEAPSNVWHIAGLDTDGRSRSVLHLFNPFAVDAVARVTFATPAGEVTLVRTDSIVVPAGQQVRRELVEDQPQQPDLGVTVEVLTGRLIAGGEVVFQPRAGEPGVQGRALVSAASGAANSWAVGYARHDAATSAWLAIMNPSDQEAAVELQASTPFPGGSTFGDLSVPAGGTVRVDLTETSESPEFGVAAVVANEVPVVVAGFTAPRGEDGRPGVGAALAAVPATDWGLPAISGEGRRTRLALYNPGTEPVTAQVTAGGATPTAWDPVELAANGWTLLDITDVAGDRAAVAVRVRASAPVVAEAQSLGVEGDIRFWKAAGAARDAWAGSATRPAVRRDGSLANRPVPSAAEEP